MPSDFKMGFLDCAIYSGHTNCSYLMKNEKLIEFNFSNNSIVKGPINITEIWEYLLPPFSSVDKVCSIYAKLMKSSDKRREHWEKKYYKECKRVAKKEYDANLQTYNKIVNRAQNEYNKDISDKQKIESNISRYEKLLKNKKKEQSSYEKKLNELKAMTCKGDETCSDARVKVPICTKASVDPRKKKIKVIETETLGESIPIEKCFNDTNIGSEYEGGFNFFKHPKFKDYKLA
jgi:hypothetical protein